MAENQMDMLGGVSADTRAVALDKVPDHKWPKNLVELIEVAEARFKRHGMDDTQAFRWARELVVAQAKHFGGRPYYLPTGEALDTAMKHAEIYRTANRSNIDRLATEHDLTVSQIYRICREQRKLHMRRIQPELPLGGGA